MVKYLVFHIDAPLLPIPYDTFVLSGDRRVADDSLTGQAERDNQESKDGFRRFTFGENKVTGNDIQFGELIGEILFEAAEFRFAFGREPTFDFVPFVKFGQVEIRGVIIRAGFEREPKGAFFIYPFDLHLVEITLVVGLPGATGILVIEVGAFSPLNRAVIVLIAAEIELVPDFTLSLCNFSLF